MIDNWINERSDWINEFIESQYINISTYRPLSGSSYMDLPDELKSPRKGLINIKKKIKNVFYGVMLDILTFQINIQKEFKKLTKKLLKNLIELKLSDKIEFPVQEKDFNKIEVKNNICINVFGYENRLVFPIYISDQKFKGSMDLLLLSDNDKSHYVYIKDFNRYMFHKTKQKNKKWFSKSCFTVF